MRYLGADLICTTPMCDEGKASIEEMDKVYTSVDASTQEHFQSAHDSLMTAFHNEWDNHWIAPDWIPFSSACCNIQQLGKQADILARNMQSYAGQAVSPAGPGSYEPPPILGAGGLLDLGPLVWAIGAVAALLLYQQFSHR